MVLAVLADWRTAPIGERLRAMLGYLEKVTLTPAEVSPADVIPLRAAGLTDRAIQEALYVCFLFNLMDRLADSFDYKIPSAKGVQMDGQLLYRLGYRIASVPG